MDVTSIVQEEPLIRKVRRRAPRRSTRALAPTRGRTARA